MRAEQKTVFACAFERSRESLYNSSLHKQLQRIGYRQSALLPSVELQPKSHPNLKTQVLEPRFATDFDTIKR